MRSIRETILRIHESQKDAPNYRYSKMCGNCKFYKGEESTGHCSLFDFTANSLYLCDDWKGRPDFKEKGS